MSKPRPPKSTGVFSPYSPADRMASSADPGTEPVRSMRAS